MSVFIRGVSALRRVSLVAFAGVTIALTGCATHYVDGATREVAASEYHKPAAAQPVQVFFEFQTKGVANTAATSLLKAQVVQKVKDSGLFSTVEETPVKGGGLLSVKLNNVPIGDDAFSKGFVTGLTFGLAGSQVSDGYVCTVTYMVDGHTPITKSARHAIHTTIGAAPTPGAARKANSVNDAVTQMTSQVLSTALNDLSHDSAFTAQ
ncbi:hypothetical protein [Variovorax sp. Sphag1AA]|uniref:hypothetical protein n=1 Tax=Variovorax sp. Sphag1AA TaxID=2587027 RepID=UPI001859B811|nr:hypothetical protein [Variovorax sp. Sphag1AA]MBB3175843.1 hypothetical protein [Variovorax sp. Sphag1AA]